MYNVGRYLNIKIINFQSFFFTYVLFSKKKKLVKFTMIKLLLINF